MYRAARLTAPTGHLQDNLTALGRLDPSLVRRLSLPVDDRHVRQDETGRWLYRIHQTDYALALGEEALAASGRLDVADGQEVLVFGAGLGEQAAFLLREHPSTRVTVWDRDPWLLRLTLSLRDLRGPIGAGRLRLALGADLLDYVASEVPHRVVAHPFLGEVYAPERALLEQGVRPRRALVCAGTLFVADVTEALQRAGYTVFTLETTRQAKEELERTVERVDPDVVVSVNYTNGLAEFCQAQGRTLVCWEIDPSTNALPPLAGPSTRSYVFTYRSANVEAFRAAGFEHVEYLPLAANVERRAPAELSPDDQARYGAPVSFVGSSLTERVPVFLAEFGARYRAFKGGVDGAEQEARAIVDHVLAQQRETPDEYRVPELLRAHCPEFLDDAARDASQHDPVQIVAELAAAEKRLFAVAGLGRHGIRVWGDAGWRSLERFGVQYMGAAGHTHELNKIYQGSVVNVDVGRIYQADIVTMRIFDILACGGFVIAEHSPALDELFAVGEELEAYRSMEELGLKVEYYLEHPEEAREIACKGLRAVRERHSVNHRVARMLAAAGVRRAAVGGGGRNR